MIGLLKLHSVGIKWNDLKKFWYLIYYKRKWIDLVKDKNKSKYLIRAWIVPKSNYELNHISPDLATKTMMNRIYNII